MKSASLPRIVAFALFGVLTGCVSNQPVSEVPAQVVVTSVPPQRSYLDPGPVPTRGDGPNYVRSNIAGSPNTDDRFGSDLLPRW
jgi:hypothetical protein